MITEEELEKGEFVTLDELMKEYGYTDKDLQPSTVREKSVKPYAAKSKPKKDKPKSRKNVR